MNTSSVVLWLAEAPLGIRPGRALDGLAYPGVGGARGARGTKSTLAGALVAVGGGGSRDDRHHSPLRRRSSPGACPSWSRSSSQRLLRKAPCRWRTRCRFWRRGQRRSADRQTPTAGPHRRSESAQRSMRSAGGSLRGERP